MPPEAPSAPQASPAADTQVSQGAPATGARPSSFRPPNPALEAAKERMFGKFGYKSPTPAPTRKAEPVTEKPAKLEPTKSDEPAKQDVPGQHPESGDPKASGELAREGAEGLQADDAPGSKESEDKGLEAPAKEKKVSVYRLLDDYKKTTAELRTKIEGYEKEISTLKSSKPPEIPKEVQEELTAARAKIKEYEDDIRFSNYQKHPEYIEKYWKPYEAEFSKTMHKLEGIPVNLPDGTTRPIDTKDIMGLLMMTAAEAEKKANESFGEYGGTVIRRVEKLQDLFDAQREALDDAKKNGAAREKQWREQMETQQKEVREVIENTWSAARREATTDPKHGKYFTPIEGDQKGNAALAKGLEFADKVFKLNPMEPGISKEERQDRVKRHAAAFYRQAAYPRMRQWLEERDAEIAELKKEREEWLASEPAQVGEKTKPTAATKGQPNFFDGFREKLRKNAR